MRSIKIRIDRLERLLAELPAHQSHDPSDWGLVPVPRDVLFEGFVIASQALRLDTHEGIVNFVTQATADNIYCSGWDAEGIDLWAGAILESMTENEG